MQETYIDVDIGHFPQSDKPSDRADFALKTFLKFKDDVEEQISRKKITAKFVRDWGEYQKAVAMLFSLHPDVYKQLNMRAAKQHQSEIKSLARQWYVLWFEQYKKEQAAKRKVSREIFNKHFENVIQQIRTGARSICNDINRTNVLVLIGALASKPDDMENFGLSAFFTTKFYGSAVKDALKRAQKNQGLPPADINKYPLKK